MKFFIVDAFADELFGGNPAGVIIVNGDFPAEKIMLKTAAELRYSETAFVKKLGNTSFEVKYFTPVAEVDLCGHATIALFSALKVLGWVQPANIYQAKTRAGNIKILIEDNLIWMDMAKPCFFGETLDVNQMALLYNIMGIKQALTTLPSIVSTGLKDILLPVANLDALNQISPDFKALARLSKTLDVVGVHAFTLNPDDGIIHARNFAPLYAIDEEAATGTANGALAYYLYNKKMLEPSKQITVIQGEKMGRKSLVFSRIEMVGDEPVVKVGGTAVILAKGDIIL